MKANEEPDARVENQPIQKTDACFLVAEMQMMPYDSCEEHQQNGCWKIAAITSVTLQMPLAIGISTELSPSQLLNRVLQALIAAIFGEQYSDADCLKSHQPIQAFVCKCACFCVCVCLDAFIYIYNTHFVHTFSPSSRSERKS